MLSGLARHLVASSLGNERPKYKYSAFNYNLKPFKRAGVGAGSEVQICPQIL